MKYDKVTRTSKNGEPIELRDATGEVAATVVRHKDGKTVFFVPTDWTVCKPLRTARIRRRPKPIDDTKDGDMI